MQKYLFLLLFGPLLGNRRSEDLNKSVINQASIDELVMMVGRCNRVLVVAISEKRFFGLSYDLDNAQKLTKDAMREKRSMTDT